MTCRFCQSGYGRTADGMHYTELGFVGECLGMSDNSEQEAFEKFVKSRGGSVMKREGRYMESMTRLWWECWQAARAPGEQSNAGAVPEAIRAIADKLEQVEGKSAEGGYMWDARECADFIREEADKITTAPTAPAVESGGQAIHQFQPLSANGGWRDCGERDLRAFQQDGLYATRTLYTHPHNGEQGVTATTDWMQVIEQNCWDLRCTSEPTGGDDYDVLWHVIEHHMAEPHERTLASDLCPIRALERALNPPTEREGDSQ